MMPILETLPKLAKRLTEAGVAVSARMLRNEIARGRLRAAKIGKSWYVEPSAVSDWVKACEHAGRRDSFSMDRTGGTAPRRAKTFAGITTTSATFEMAPPRTRQQALDFLSGKKLSAR